MAHKTTGFRAGQQYIASLRDDRSVWIDGERVADVTTDRRFRGAVLSVAGLYDLQSAPELRGVMTYETANGARAGLSHMQPRSRDDLAKRRAMVKRWMDSCGGMMGRTPDFLNIMVAAFAAGRQYFDVAGKAFADNMQQYHALVRDNDLALTHSLVTPDIDKSKPIYEQPRDVAMRVAREGDSGVYVSGARSVATLAPLANEIVVMPSPTKLPLRKESEAYAIGFATPVATPGLRMVCRPSLAAAGPVANHPLSSRMDEMDAVVWFDDVFIPWERVFIYRDLNAAASVRKADGGQWMHQTAIRSLSKAEFLLGIALNLVETNKLTQHLQVIAMVSEIVNAVELLRGLIAASEYECRPGPSGTVLPNEEPLLVIRQMFPSLNARMIEILQLIGAGNLVAAPSIEELDGKLADAVSIYCCGVDISAAQKIALHRLAWDASCSSFAGRQSLYEKFFSGDPWRNAINRAQGYRGAAEVKERVWSFINRNAEWDALLNRSDDGRQTGTATGGKEIVAGAKADTGLS